VAPSAGTDVTLQGAETCSSAADESAPQFPPASRVISFNSVPRGVAVSPDGRWVAAAWTELGSCDQARFQGVLTGLGVWERDAATGSLELLVRLDESMGAEEFGREPQQLEFGADSRTIFVAFTCKSKVASFRLDPDVPSLERTSVVEGESAGSACLAVSQDRTRLYNLSPFGGLRTISVLDEGELEVMQTLEFEGGWGMLGCSLDGTGRYFFVLDFPLKVLRVFSVDPETGALTFGEDIYNEAFYFSKDTSSLASPVGSTLVFCSAERNLSVLDYRGPGEYAWIENHVVQEKGQPLFPGLMAVYGLAVAPDEGRLAALDNFTSPSRLALFDLGGKGNLEMIKLLHLGGPKEVPGYAPNNDELAFSPDYRHLYAVVPGERSVWVVRMEEATP